LDQFHVFEIWIGVLVAIKVSGAGNHASRFQGQISINKLRVILDCTEVFCEMPSSLLNSELFSFYNKHVTLKGLVGIAPSGAITFVSQLYTGSTSDREIVRQSGILSQSFDNGDSVMADKGSPIQDALPLGVTLNIPPFLGNNSQVSAEGVVRTQQVASLSIQVERAINKNKNLCIWEGVAPLSKSDVECMCIPVQHS